MSSKKIPKKVKDIWRCEKSVCCVFADVIGRTKNEDFLSTSLDKLQNSGILQTEHVETAMKDYILRKSMISVRNKMDQTSVLTSSALHIMLRDELTQKFSHFDN
jgi:hypothetical protein